MTLINSMDECEAIASELEALPSTERRIELLRRLVTTHEVFNMELGRGSIFWRAQKCNAAGFDNERRLSHPPHHLAGVGRFNNQQEPSLYVSTRRETAMAEIGVESGSFVHVAGFRVRDGQGLRILLVGEWMHVYKKGFIRIGDKAVSKAVSESMNSFPPERARILIYIDAILGDLMARRDAKTDDYLSTRLLIKLLYDKLPATQGILYPSVKDDLGVNLAIRAEAADKALELCCSMVVRVDKVRPYALHDCEPIKLASDVDSEGAFRWSVPTRPDEMMLFRLTPEEVARQPKSILDLTTP